MDYSKRTDNKVALTNNIFRLFTDQCGGSPQEFADALYSKFIVEDFAYSDDLHYWGVHGYFEKVVIPHKIAVWQAGNELLKTPWIKTHLSEQEMEDFRRNLWLHDLSKFSANEAFGYAGYNFKDPHPNSKLAFEKAWHHHKMNNPHHPEYWLNPNRSGELEPLPMPNIYIMEMLADWIGAGRTYGSTLEEWLPNNIEKFRFAYLGKVKDVLEDYGIKTWIHSRDTGPQQRPFLTCNELIDL